MEAPVRGSEIGSNVTEMPSFFVTHTKVRGPELWVCGHFYTMRDWHLVARLCYYQCMSRIIMSTEKKMLTEWEQRCLWIALFLASRQSCAHICKCNITSGKAGVLLVASFVHECPWKQKHTHKNQTKKNKLSDRNLTDNQDVDPPPPLLPPSYITS